MTLQRLIGLLKKKNKVYRALLTQNGTDAPVVTVLENTLGGEVVWTRVQAGVYIATLAGAFPAAKTFVETPTVYVDLFDDATFKFERLNPNNLGLYTVMSNASADSVLTGHAVGVLVYP